MNPTKSPQWAECAGIYSLIDSSGATEAMIICEIEAGIRPNTPKSNEMEVFEQEWWAILD